MPEAKMLKRLHIQSWLCAQLVVSLTTMSLPAGALDTKTERPRMDLAFCIDTTGSMQGEIDVVKAKTRELVAKLSSSKPTPIVRVALVAFRDRGDEYVTKVFPFTEDIDKMVKDISALKADGGGDGPESVNEALHVAVNNLTWDTGKRTAKVLFLIGDAAPHVYANDYNWKTEAQHAINRGIQINTIGCNGLEGYPEVDGVGVFQQVAKLTDGKFESLAYRQEVAGRDGRRETIISSGGATYKMKSADAHAWRAGVPALEAKGIAEKIMPMSDTTGSLARRRYEGAPASAAVERRDNNLADVLLQGAQSAARKTFKEDLRSK